MKHVVSQRQIPTVQFSCVSCLSEYEVEADLNSGEIEISKVVRLSSFRGVEDCVVHYESDCPVCGAVNESTQTEVKTTLAEKKYAEVGAREPEENCYTRAIKRLNPELFHSVTDWKELEGSPGLVATLRDGRKAIITFSVDLTRYHAIVDGGL